MDLLRPGRRACLLVLLASSVAVNAQQEAPQKMPKFERDEVRQMLSNVSEDVKKHYYDPKFRGIDWNANIKNFQDRIDNATSLNRGLSEVAAALDALNDSHTFFLPPSRPYKHDYGWQIRMIGDQCYVLQVRPGSDAEKRGVRTGDQVLTINGFAPKRDNYWKMDYVFNVLRPQPALRVSLSSPNGDRKDLEVVAAIRQLPRIQDLTGDAIWDEIREFQNDEYAERMRVEEAGEVLILKFPAFVYESSQVDEIMNRARKHTALVVDLRGNGGGNADTLKDFLGNFFDHEVKIGDRVTRANTKPMSAKSRGKEAFKGKLVILIDSRSASASELLARVVQLEKRGTVIGDQSAGAVMESIHYDHKIGLDTVVFFGASVTDADLIMTDGKSLERVGVTPDERIVPTAADLAAGRDPVLAHAVEVAGGKMDPAVAGKLFPYEWPK
jgi:carboxyl-terminal processing protease